MSAPDTLAERYGARAPWRRIALIVASSVLVVAFLVWLAWTIWGHSTPLVTSELETWSVEDEHTAVAVLIVQLDDGVEATCTLRAFAEDHTIVGELAFSPDPATRRQVQEIRTERRATSVTSLGCTAPGQDRPR